MTTTFPNPQIIRDGLVSLFQSVSTGSDGWVNVYGYMPAPSVIVGRSPVLVIRRRGTTQNMSSVFMNPSSFRFLCMTMVLAYDDAANWGSDDAEDKLDELDQLFRQTIRNNAGGSTFASQLRFGTPSQVDDVVIGGKPYITEIHEIYADLASGSAV